MQHLRSISCVLLLSLLFAFQCQKNDCCVMPPCSDNHTLQGTWQLTGYRDVATGNLEGGPLVEGKFVEFTFVDNKKEGSITGKTFSNTVSGSYTLGDHCTYEIQVFGGTKVGEHEWSARAWMASGTTGNYERINNQLILYRNSGKEAMIFKRMY